MIVPSMKDLRVDSKKIGSMTAGLGMRRPILKENDQQEQLMGDRIPIYRSD
jgi:hypothetical protein